MRKKCYLSLSISVVLLFALGCKVDTQVQYDILLKNGSIIDLETGTLSVKDIWISDGKIIKVVAPNGNEKVLATDTLDATGKYILPGFWDNHVHFRGGDSLIEANKNFLTLFLANGITTVRDAGGDLTNAVLKWNREMANGTLDGPMIFTSGPKIDGPNSTWAGSLEVSDEKDISDALDSLERIPVSFVKLYDSRISGETYLNTLRATEKRGLLTSGHMPFTVRLDETVEAGIDAVEHLYYIMKGCSANEAEITAQLVKKEIGFWDAMPLLMASYTDSVAQKTFTDLKKNNVFVVPTLHIGETLSSLDDIDHQNDAYLAYMDKGIIKTYDGRIQSALNANEEQKKDRKALQQFFGALAKSLNDSGVGLLAGSDSGAYNSYTYPGISLHKELEAMVKVGIPNLDALRASAYNGARFLKKDSLYGSLSAHKVADIVILDGNPLENIAHTQRVNTVIKAGRIFTTKDLNDKLTTVAKDVQNKN